MAAFKEVGKIWMNGKFVDWKDAKIHVLSHVIHYGSSVFEGDRCYHTPKGSAIFRLGAHVRRLYDSAKIYRMKIPYAPDVLSKAIVETVRVNGYKECYIRPVVYRGYNSLGVNPTSCPVDCVIAVWEWGSYLGEGAHENGVDVMVSSWTRMAPNTFPAIAKCGANYMNAQLIKLEALTNGYTEGIALDVDGYVSEGSGENIFFVRDGKLLTPPLTSSVLPGITRDTVMTLARDMGLEVTETRIPREMLYTADEVFFTGSAAEITPLRSVDKVPVGDGGKRGPITEKLQKAFASAINGETPDKHGWLTFV